MEWPGHFLNGISPQLSFSEDFVDSRFIKTITNLCTTCALGRPLVYSYSVVGSILWYHWKYWRQTSKFIAIWTRKCNLQNNRSIINTQTTLQLDVSNSCTESIRVVRVCNTPVSHRVFKKNCRGKNVGIDFSNCFHQALTCKFTYDCC